MTKIFSIIKFLMGFIVVIIHFIVPILMIISLMKIKIFNGLSIWLKIFIGVLFAIIFIGLNLFILFSLGFGFATSKNIVNTNILNWIFTCLYLIVVFFLLKRKYFLSYIILTFSEIIMLIWTKI